MKKVIMLACLVLLLTGCVKIETSDNDYIQIINYCLNDNDISNNVALGYKFYVPRGVKLIKNYDYNQNFLIDDNYLYLYVDIISYYYNNKLNYDDSLGNYYYQEFSFDNKEGYIAISENENNEYYVTIIYNYAKIEFYSTEDKLPKLISLSTIILNNIKYNNIIIEDILEKNSGDFSNVTYELDKPEDASSNFSQFLEEYVQEETEEQTLPDE